MQNNTHTGNTKHLATVTVAIQEHVLDFANRQKAASGNPPFHMEDLTSFVLRRVRAAPDSPGRILRALKNAGKLDYVVVNRAASHYQFV